MKKLLALMFISMFYVAPSVLAAPLNDYAKPGNLSLGLWWQRSDVKRNLYNITNANPSIHYFEKKWNTFGEATVVVAPKLALSIDYGGYRGGETVTEAFGTLGYIAEEVKLKSLNLKARYEVYNKNRLFIAPYLGWARNKLEITQKGYGSVTINPDQAYLKTNTKNNFLLGVTAIYGLDKDETVKTYLDVGFGSKVRSLNFGLSYQIVKDLDIDLGYKWYKAKNMEYATPFAHVDNNITSKGIYLGLTYSFK